MVGDLLTALFSTVGYCLLMNVPVKKIIPASVGGMLSWLLYLLLKDRVQSVFYLLVLVGAFAATYSEIAAKTDSFMTVPRLPVSSSFPVPSTTFTSTSSVVPPTLVQARPVTRPT